MDALAAIARYRFAHLPTPIEPLTRIRSWRAGPQLFVKRDDCTGLAGGGNKARKLEFLMADARQKGADTIITRGGLQSNHVRQTAAIAARMGMRCEAILDNPIASDETQYRESGNVFLDRLFGAVIHPSAGEAESDALERQLREAAEAHGRRPYVIPLGGSNALGALGYVLCAEEILRHSADLGADFDYVIVPTGSGGTQAGLVVGLAESSTRVVGISVWEPRARQEATVLGIAGEVLELLGSPRRLPADRVVVRDEYVGEGYGFPTPGSVEAIRLLAGVEGLLLDPVYSGKAMAGLLDLIAVGFFKPRDRILFLHTGGSQALDGYRSWLAEDPPGPVLPVTGRTSAPAPVPVPIDVNPR